MVRFTTKITILRSCSVLIAPKHQNHNELFFNLELTILRHDKKILRNEKRDSTIYSGNLKFERIYMKTTHIITSFSFEKLKVIRIF